MSRFLKIASKHVMPLGKPGLMKSERTCERCLDGQLPSTVLLQRSGGVRRVTQDVRVLRQSEHEPDDEQRSGESKQQPRNGSSGSGARAQARAAIVQRCLETYHTERAERDRQIRAQKGSES